MSRAKFPIAKPDDFDGLTLMHLRVENSRRLRLADISIDRPLTLIGGDNAQGKSSLLDSLVMLVGDKKVIKNVTLNPIHNGEQVGVITADFGDGQDVRLTVTKRLKRVGDDDFTAELDVEIPGYITPSRVQEFLNALAGEMTFDPLEFDSLPEAKQFELLRRFVPDFDFADNQAVYDAVFKARTDINRDLKRAQAAADAIQVSEDPPYERVDEAALTSELRAVGEHNADVEMRRNNRSLIVQRIADLRDSAAKLRSQIDIDCREITETYEQDIRDIEDQIRELKQRIENKRKALADKLKEVRESLTRQAAEKTEQADALQKKIDSAAPLPELKDAGEIEKKLEAARAQNKVIDDWEARRNRKAEHQAEADRLAKQSESLTADLAELQRRRQEAIQKARLPIDGLGFGDGYVTLNGQRWTDASTAERVDASTAIAMALNPKIRTILIRNGSIVGKKIRERIQQRAAERGYRVLMEIVDDTGANSHVFIEDGLVVKQQDDEKKASVA